MTIGIRQAINVGICLEAPLPADSMPNAVSPPAAAAMPEAALPPAIAPRPLWRRGLGRVLRPVLYRFHCRVQTAVEQSSVPRSIAGVSHQIQHLQAQMAHLDHHIGQLDQRLTSLDRSLATITEMLKANRLTLRRLDAASTEIRL